MLYIKKILIMSATLSLMLVSVGTQSNAADVYTWVDAQGVMHYSDKPFKSAKKQRLRFSRAAEAAEKQEETELDASNTDLFDATDNERLSSECKSAQDNVTTLLKGGKISGKDADGNAITLDTEQMNAKLQESQTYLQRYCKTSEDQSGT